MATPTNNVGLQLYKTLLTPNTASTHLLLFSTLFGSHLWHGAIGGPLTFKNVPRQTFGLLQSKIFPVYFATGTLIPTALIGNLALAQGGFKDLPVFPVATLAISAVANAINWFFLGPKATSIMFERHRLEKEEGIDAYKDKDKVRLHPSLARCDPVLILILTRLFCRHRRKCNNCPRLSHNFTAFQCFSTLHPLELSSSTAR